MKKYLKVSVLIFSCVLYGCVSGQKIVAHGYHQADKQFLLALQSWYFKGRLALHSREQSWSAHLDWAHQRSHDRLKLYGPLGQAAVALSLSGECLSITQGSKNSEFSCQPDALIRRRVGVFVPIHNLPFWVLGLPGPETSFEPISGGFQQAGWTVVVREAMLVGEQLMPHKIVITNDITKLKLVIDEWEINDLTDG